MPPTVRLADVTKLLGQFQQPNLGSDDLLVLGHFVISVPSEGGARSQLAVTRGPSWRRKKLMGVLIRTQHPPHGPFPQFL